MQAKIYYLVGPMGAGKSTVGKLLAHELKIPFYDSDREIEERCGASISWIFDIEGEKGFCKREITMIEELSHTTGVISTGAGVIVSEENRRVMAATGCVIFLNASLETQIKRTEKDKTRPLLQKPNREEVIRKLYSMRTPLYQELADVTVITDDGSPRKVVQAILKALEE